ncbi:unnamed protein product [Strongylus vulgaris]|uniref:Uncharacterized protein n=1 Tax=Strongylus vulgaris TaxID=40348 RepID=A0A3P7LX83_STRVU|nr:unnamed protein product [Strongylus vulgaris]
MRSYHLAWLPFESVLCIRKPSLLSTQLMIPSDFLKRIGGGHPQREVFLQIFRW